MKYSINGTGNIVAERDIYSLGGFIPKGTVGGKIASEAQLSQDGECWLAGGSISGRPDIVIKDNAYVGTFTPSANPVHTDGVTEFSGDTLIPGRISIRSFATDNKNNVFIKDSFIGVSMDVLCGPRTTTTAFPFEQGGYVSTAPRGTAFSSVVMQTGDVNICRSTDSVIICGLNTYVYLPTGYSGRILWSYTQGGTAVYSGESKVIPSGLTKIEHPVYRRFMLHITKVNGTAMTPTDLLATGAKILGHINGNLLQDLRPESASGEYAMVNSSFIAETDNFGLNTTQLRFLAGGMYDTTMYTKTDRQDYKPYGTFRNVERLEYTKYLGDSHRTAATRDTYISAYDCPLLRVDDDTYDTSLMGTGDLVLRRCIVPKGRFAADPINGNTYEDLDFSYANEDLGFSLPGYAVFTSSNRKGMYRVKAGTSTLGLVSHKGNLTDTARLFQAVEYTPLDGSIMEHGSYGAGGIGSYYESAKSDSPIRVRTGKPLPTFGLVFPSLPAGYSVRALYYLDDGFIIRSTSTDPAGLDTTYPYVVMLFRKDDDSAINVTDFIALNRTLQMTDHTKFPEITGSAYVGAGCIVRGDVQLHGDPYVNRVFDVNMWERGISEPLPGGSWQGGFSSPGAHNRMRSKNLIQVEPGATIKRTDNNLLLAWFFDSFGKRTGSSSTGWVTSFVVPEGVSYVGLMIAKDGLLTEEDIPLANVKYLRAFKKRRYITNELDRTSPEDILLCPDYWEQGYLDRIVGKTYEVLKSASSTYVRLRRPVNTGKGAVSSHGGGFGNKDASFDAITKCVTADDTIVDGTPLYGATVYKAPSAAITPSEIPNSRLVLEFVPSPRIIVPYGRSTLSISGPKIRMYDNAVLSRNIGHDADIVLQGDAVMGYDFSSGGCLCSNGHDDAIIKLP